MKEFLKMMIAILVIIVIGGTLYFFLSHNADYRDNQGQTMSGDEKIESGELQGDLQNEREEGKAENEVKPSGDVMESEKEINLSGDTEELEKKIAQRNMIETKNRLANLTKSFDDSVGAEIVGEKNKEFIEEFYQDGKIPVTIQVAGTMVNILPMPDFVDNAQYHYDENGNLALYICELTGVGGEVRYYFENNDLLSVVKNVEEGVEISQESVDEILERAKVVYQKYMQS